MNIIFDICRRLFLTFALLLLAAFILVPCISMTFDVPGLMDSFRPMADEFLSWVMRALVVGLGLVFVYVLIVVWIWDGEE